MKIYQSFLGENQRAHVSPCVIPYDVAADTAPDQREYEIFKAIHSRAESGHEPWGVLSWKFEHKSLVSVEEFATFAGRMFDRGYDCVFLNPMIGNEAVFINVWEQGQITHGNMSKIYDLLRSITVAPGWAPMGHSTFAFCNYFVANGKFWASYFSFVDYVLDQLQAETERRSEVGAIYAGAANYARNRSLTMRPFIIERLFSTFVSIPSSLRIAPFRHTPDHYRRKFGERLGALLHALSALKNRGIAGNDKPTLTAWHATRAGLLRATGMQGLIMHLDDPHTILLSPEVQALLGQEHGPAPSVRRLVQ